MGEGKYLTEGVYFVPEDDAKSETPGAEWRSDGYTIWSESTDDFSLNDAFKGERESKMGTQVLNTSPFNQVGNVVFPESAWEEGCRKHQDSYLSVGAPNPGGEGKPLRFDNPNAISGILLRRYGGFAVLELDDFE